MSANFQMDYFIELVIIWGWKNGMVCQNWNTGFALTITWNMKYLLSQHFLVIILWVSLVQFWQTIPFFSTSNQDLFNGIIHLEIWGHQKLHIFQDGRFYIGNGIFEVRLTSYLKNWDYNFFCFGLSTISLCPRTIKFKKFGWVFYVNLDLVSVWGCGFGAYLSSQFPSPSCIDFTISISD